MRAGLSQYERGRAAAVAVYDGVFDTVDEAVSALFRQASKAKRSKNPLFCAYPRRVWATCSPTPPPSASANACAWPLLYAGGLAENLRNALEHIDPSDPSAEWDAMLPVIEQVEGTVADPARGGRPKTVLKVTRSRQTKLANGISIEKESGPDGYAIRFHGRNVSSDLVDSVMDNIRHLLEADLILGPSFAPRP